MAENLSIESPDFDRIKKESGPSTRDAVQLLWFVANGEGAERRRGVRAAQEEDLKKTKSDAPTTDQHNYDTEGSPIIVFVGSTSFNLTGIRNGLQGMGRTIHNLGTGTITLKHESALSDATNRLDTNLDADVPIPTGQCARLRYLNSRWRQEVSVSADSLGTTRHVITASD
jgi:hypothetical protein